MSEERIRSLVESNPGQASEAEYTLVHDVIAQHAPCNVLVFGVGRDSSLWIDTNEGGRKTSSASVSTHCCDRTGGLDFSGGGWRGGLSGPPSGI